MNKKTETKTETKTDLKFNDFVAKNYLDNDKLIIEIEVDDYENLVRMDREEAFKLVDYINGAYLNNDYSKYSCDGCVYNNTTNDMACGSCGVGYVNKKTKTV